MGRKILRFKALLESKQQEGQDIIDAIHSTEAGNDLTALAKFTFDLKRTGRIWVHANIPLSKTYIQKTGGEWMFGSLSNGSPFGEEYFDSPEEVMRGLWSKIVSKNSPTGLPKKELREWLDSTDCSVIGKKLPIEEIWQSYPFKVAFIKDPMEFMKAPALATLISSLDLDISFSGGAYVTSSNNEDIHNMYESSQYISGQGIPWFFQIEMTSRNIISFVIYIKMKGRFGVTQKEYGLNDHHLEFHIRAKPGGAEEAAEEVRSMIIEHLKTFDQKYPEMNELVKLLVEKIENGTVGTLGKEVNDFSKNKLIETVISCPAKACFLLGKAKKEYLQGKPRLRGELIDFSRIIFDFRKALYNKTHKEDNYEEYIEAFNLPEEEFIDYMRAKIIREDLENVKELIPENPKFVMFINFESLQKMLDDNPTKFIMYFRTVMEDKLFKEYFDKLKFPNRDLETLAAALGDISDLSL